MNNPETLTPLSKDTGRGHTNKQTNTHTEDQNETQHRKQTRCVTWIRPNTKSDTSEWEAVSDNPRVNHIVKTYLRPLNVCIQFIHKPSNIQSVHRPDNIQYAHRLDDI